MPVLKGHLYQAGRSGLSPALSTGPLLASEPVCQVCGPEAVSSSWASDVFCCDYAVT